MTKKKQRTGIVISDKMNKTIIVKIQRRTFHPLYKRTITAFSKVKAHDEKNAAKIGNTVRIVETRPLSKDKRWRLVEIVGKEGNK